MVGSRQSGCGVASQVAIKAFKLALIKRSPDDKVSTCIPDTKRVSATRFGVVRRNFTPTEDLKVVFFSKEPPP